MKIIDETIEKIFGTGLVHYINQYYFPYVREFTKNKEKYIKNKLKKISFNRLLDFGCSIGHISPFVPEKKYVGFDINRSYINFARKRYPSKKFVLSNKLSFQKNEFDLILCSFVLHHINEVELKSTIKKFNEILSDRGQIIVLEAMPIDKQDHPLIKLIMNNDIGENYKYLEGWKKCFSDNFKLKTANFIKFGKYNIYEIIFSKN